MVCFSVSFWTQILMLCDGGQLDLQSQLISNTMQQKWNNSVHFCLKNGWSDTFRWKKSVLQTHFQLVCGCIKHIYLLPRCFPAVRPPLICQELSSGSHRADGGPATFWEMTLQNSWHSSTGEGGNNRGGEKLFPPKVKHGNDYVHCCWRRGSLLSPLSLTQYSLSPHWPFSNVNGWLTGRGRSGGGGGGGGGTAIHSRWGGEALHARWNPAQEQKNLGRGSGEESCAENTTTFKQAAINSLRSKAASLLQTCSGWSQMSKEKDCLLSREHKCLFSPQRSRLGICERLAARLMNNVRGHLETIMCIFPTTFPRTIARNALVLTGSCSSSTSSWLPSPPPQINHHNTSNSVCPLVPPTTSSFLSFSAGPFSITDPPPSLPPRTMSAPLSSSPLCCWTSAWNLNP